MRDQPRGGASVGVIERGPTCLSGRLHGGVSDAVGLHGFAHVPGALAFHDRRRLLEEARRAGPRFLALPDRVNGVAQRADQLTLRIGDPGHPAVNDLAGTVVEAVAGWPAASAAPPFRPTEARYMRYTGDAAGLGAHVDGKFYRVLVCVFSLLGSAEFSVVADDRRPPMRFPVGPGDLLVLRAPGFGGATDGRPRHAVGPPLDGDERVSLTLRMVGATSAPA